MRLQAKSLFIVMVCLCCALVIANIYYAGNWFVGHKAALPRVAVLLLGAVEFFLLEQKAMREAAHAAGLEAVFFNAGWNPAEQIHQLEQALFLPGLAAIALCAVDNHALMVVSTLMEHQQVPLVTFTNGIGPDPYGALKGVRTHIGRDEVKAGRMLGRAIERLALQEAPRILFIEGAPGTPPQRFRTQGFQMVLAEHPTWVIAERVAVPGWNTAEVEREVQRALERHLDFNVIATQWAGAAIAADQALQNNRIHGKQLVTLEYTLDLQRLLLTGLAQSTSNFSVAEEGRRTIDTVVRLLKHEEVPTFVEIPQVVIRPEEARSTLPEW